MFLQKLSFYSLTLNLIPAFSTKPFLCTSATFQAIWALLLNTVFEILRLVPNRNPPSHGWGCSFSTITFQACRWTLTSGTKLEYVWDWWDEVTFLVVKAFEQFFRRRIFSSLDTTTNPTTKIRKLFFLSPLVISLYHNCCEFEHLSSTCSGYFPNILPLLPRACGFFRKKTPSCSNLSACLSPRYSRWHLLLNITWCQTFKFYIAFRKTGFSNYHFIRGSGSLKTKIQK